MSQKQTRPVKLIDVMNFVKRFISWMLSQVKWFFVITVFTSLLAFGYYLMQKPSYEASVTFILEEKSGMSGGGLMGLASQFGIDIGSLGGGGAGMFSGDNILDIIKSRTIVEKALLSKVDSSTGESGQTIADLYLDFSGLRSKWQGGKSKELSSLTYSAVKTNKEHSLLQDSVLNYIYERVTEKNLNADRLNKKGSIIKISTVSGNPVFSKLLTEQLVKETRKMYIDIKTGIAVANVKRLEQKADSLTAIINSKSYQSASAQVLDANAAYKTAAVPSEIAQRDRVVAYAIYTEVVKNLEAGRMTVANQTPVIQLLDVPKFPLEDKRKPLLLLLVAGIAAGIAISFLFAFVTFPSGDE
jgi:uncharacterized protein involved in exopolysaccharide biosynthesis